MGHSDDSISFSKTRVAASQHSNLTFPVRHPSPSSQSIPPLLASGSPLKHNATKFPQDISAAHIYSQSRDAISSSAATNNSRYRSVHKSTGVSSPVQIPGNLPNPNPTVLSQRQYRVFQAPTYLPTTVAPSYTTTAQSYGDVKYASELRDRASLPVQISGGVPHTNSAMDNHVLSQQQYKASQAPTYPLKTIAPSYTATAQNYGDGDDAYASEFWDRINLPVQISGGVPITNPAVDNPVLLEQQLRVFQAPTYPPTTVAPSHNTAARYGGDAGYASGMGGTSSPSSSSACSFQDSYSGLDVDLPAQVSDDISGRYLTVPSLQGFHKFISSSIALAPSYGSHTVQGYTDDASHTPLPSNSTLRYSNSPAHSFTYRSTCGLAPQFPLPSIPTTPTSHLNTLHQTPLAGHNYQTMIPREQGRQQPLSHASQVFIIDGCRIEGVDLVDQASADGNIIIGQCLRTDIPCQLWVKADKRSLKRHLKRWHNFTRGGDSNKTSCTWQGCNYPMQKSAIPRHTMRKHFNETFECNGCDRNFTRYECWRNHAPKCEFSNLGWTVRYGGGTRIINVSGMSLSQGTVDDSQRIWVQSNQAS